MSLLLLFNNSPPWYRSLLDSANRLINEGHPEIAVVTAQMACEIYTETVFAELMRKRGIAYLEESIAGLLPNYNLGNDKVRRAYVALSNDEIQKQPFWPAYKNAVKLRNGSIHRGERVTKDAAEIAIQAYGVLVDHLKALLTASSKPG